MLRLDIEGILLFDKPKDFTSHDIVKIVRKKFSNIKVGHAGTLDPMATGLLVLVIGKATKFVSHFINDDKTYEAEMLLGATTDTLDACGKVTQQKPVPSFSQEELEQVFRSFLGESMQIPPMYSALHYKGKRLYELARNGVEVERPPREIKIYNLKIMKFETPKINFQITCSKGTYVRAVVRDLGEKLNTVAHITALKRISSGAFNLQNAINIDQFKQTMVNDLYEKLIPLKDIQSMVENNK